MKDLTITAIIKVYQYDELNEADQSLMKTAMEATARSYAPYSHFSVGAAALLNDGTIVTGTNQENADRLSVAFLRLQNNLAAGAARRNRFFYKILFGSCCNSEGLDRLVGILRVSIKQGSTFRAKP